MKSFILSATIIAVVSAADTNTTTTLPTKKLQPWEIDTQNYDVKNISQDTLNIIQNIFVRFKGLYEGLYKGFYRNDEATQQ